MLFNEIIGQQAAKERLNFHFEAFAAGEAVPTLMFTGSRGIGKTSIATAAGLELKRISGDKKKMLLINSAGVKNLKQFWQSVVMTHINDRDVTLLLDEASELPSDVTMALLTITNPTANHVNSYTYDDYTVDFDLRRQNFMFATTEPHKIFHALKNRCREINLTDYTLADLSLIVQKNAPEIEFQDGVLDLVSPTLRHNARTATMMAADIKTYLAPLHKKNFSPTDWAAMSKRLDILPLGLTRSELEVLRILSRRKDTSLTRLAATLGLTPQAVQRDLEIYLQKLGLIEIRQATGRNISSEGQAYLKNFVF